MGKYLLLFDKYKDSFCIEFNTHYGWLTNTKLTDLFRAASFLISFLKPTNFDITVVDGFVDDDDYFKITVDALKKPKSIEMNVLEELLFTFICHAYEEDYRLKALVYFEEINESFTFYINDNGNLCMSRLTFSLTLKCLDALEMQKKVEIQD